MQQRPSDQHDHKRGQRASDSGLQRRAALRAQRQDDERHFEAFEEHGLVGEPEPDIVPTVGLQAGGTQLGDFMLVDHLFVMQGDDAGETEDGFAQPAHAE